MQIGTFRKNVMKTVATKPAKLGLRLVSKNTARTNLTHATVSLKTHTGQLLQALSQYMLGQQFSQEMKDSAATAMADMGYDLTILCRVLKCKMPAATKKSKLSGTRTAALLQLDGLTTQLLQLMERGTFAGPPMKKVTKMVVLPNKGGQKEEREVDVVHTEAEQALENERQAQMKSLLSGIVDVYWRLSYEMFQKPPAALFEEKFGRMQKEYTGIQFTIPEEKSEEQKAAPAAEPKPKAAKPKAKSITFSAHKTTQATA